MYILLPNPILTQTELFKFEVSSWLWILISFLRDKQLTKNIASEGKSKEQLCWNYVVLKLYSWKKKKNSQVEIIKAFEFNCNCLDLILIWKTMYWKCLYFSLAEPYNLIKADLFCYHLLSVACKQVSLIVFKEIKGSYFKLNLILVAVFLKSGQGHQKNWKVWTVHI